MVEGTQAIAAHKSPRTAKLYDCTGDDIALEDLETIAISRARVLCPLAAGGDRKEFDCCIT